MIVVTGANGQLGRAVVEGLLTRLPADRIVASVQDPAKATELAERGVHVRAGDFAEPNRLAATFAGATQVLVVSVDKLGATALRLHHAAIEAAHAAGARRVLYTSHMGARGTRPLRRRPITPQPRRSWLKQACRSRRCATASTPRVRCISSGTDCKQAKSARPKTAR